MFFFLIEGCIEDAMLIYSNMINETVLLDPALEKFIGKPVMVCHPLGDPGLKGGLQEIKDELYRRFKAVVRERNGLVYFEPETGATKRPVGSGGRPEPKPEIPMHDVVLRMKLGENERYEKVRWPGEQSRRTVEKNVAELHLKVPNLAPIVGWCMVTTCMVRPNSPPELCEMMQERIRRFCKSAGVDVDGEDGFAE